ncbi:MAG: translation initiation factor IF-5A [Candidatus Nanoarchaeia archaeon]|nr:translation initiation factor IF-5A [Candidatus Nanoarchaeia archaeon]
MSSEVRPIDLHDVKVGRYIIIDGVPCVVKNITSSAPGKHGHAKFRIEGEGVFDGKKRIVAMSGHGRVESPVIDKKNAQVLSISGNKVQVMDMETYETFELDMPLDPEVAKKVREGESIIFWEVMGIRQIK